MGAGHAVTGTTRSAANAAAIEKAGGRAVVLDVYDAPAVMAAVAQSQAEVLIHQLTDLPREPDQTKISASYAANARIRVEGTRNLIAAARAAGVRRLIVQSIAFAYAPGGEPHPETDPLNLADPLRAVTVKGTVDMEEQVLNSGMRRHPAALRAVVRARHLVARRPLPQAGAARRCGGARGFIGAHPRRARHLQHRRRRRSGCDRQGARRARIRPEFSPVLSRRAGQFRRRRFDAINSRFRHT
jgi:hypothetical protein